MRSKQLPLCTCHAVEGYYDIRLETAVRRMFVCLINISRKINMTNMTWVCFSHYRPLQRADDHNKTSGISSKC